MYRTVRDNVVAAHNDAESAKMILIILCIVIGGPVFLIQRGCGDGRKPKPPIKAPVVPTATSDTAPVQTRSMGRRAWDRTNKVWHALRDDEEGK